MERAGPSRKGIDHDHLGKEPAVIISGVVVASRPEHLSEISREVDGLPWAEVHFSDPRGRLVVTLEASDLDESVERMKTLQALPRVLSAALAEFCSDGAMA
jgi:nitrate reductase NapAB chaperone NapD